MRRLARAFVFLLALLTAGAAAGSEADREAARRVALEGFRLLQQHDYQGAIAKFRVAEQLVHAPPHLYYMAQAHTELGQLLEAQRLCRQIVAEQLAADAPAPFRKAQEDATAKLRELDARIPLLTVVVVGAADATVLVDGNKVERLEGIALDPGEHRVIARSQERRDATTTVKLEEGARERVTLRFAPISRVEREDSKPWLVPAIVAFAVGGVGIAAGIATGVASLDKVSELEERCPTKQCPPEDESIANEAETFGNASTAMFVIGGVALGVGVVLVAWQPGSRSELRVTPGGIAFGARF